MSGKDDEETQTPSHTHDVCPEASISRFSAEYLWNCKACKQSDIAQPESLKKRIIVVCFDGTANAFGEKSSNVAQFYSQIVEDENQIPYYNSGVGTFAKKGTIWKNVKGAVDSTIDQAIAWNLESVLLGGYRFLVENYRPGYRIFIYGFSRGAYQARALAAMIAKVGLLRKGNEEQIPFAYELYRAGSGGITEKLWNLVKKVLPGASTMGKETLAGLRNTFKEGFAQKYARVHFLGIWDTVSSVGLMRGKNLLPGTDGVHKYTCYARHALALDERRVKFLPEYVIVGEDKNSDPAIPQGDIADKEKRSDPSLPPHVKEVWFAGCHSDVGGGAQNNETLDQVSPSYVWMTNQSQIHGLRLKRPKPRKLDELVKTTHHESLKWLWYVPEILPVRRFSYNSCQHTRRPHVGRGRVVMPSQIIHLSVWLQLNGDKSTYTPRANQAKGSTCAWEDFRKKPNGTLPQLITFLLDETQWSGTPFDKLEMDLVDLSLIDVIVKQVIELKFKNSKSTFFQDLLKFLSRSREGAECILSYFDTSVEALSKIVASKARKSEFFFFRVISTSITNVAFLPDCLDGFISIIIDLEADSKKAVLSVEALTVIARHHGRLPLPMLHDETTDWYSEFLPKYWSLLAKRRWAAIICLASIFYGRFVKSHEYGHFAGARHYLDHACKELEGGHHGNLLRDRALQNCKAYIKEAGAVLNLSDAESIIKATIQMRNQPEEEVVEPDLDIINTHTNLARHLLHGELGHSSEIQAPTFIRRDDPGALSSALLTLAQSHYELLTQYPSKAENESITPSTIRDLATKAEAQSREDTLNKSKALDLISKCFLEEKNISRALSVSEMAVDHSRTLVSSDGPTPNTSSPPVSQTAHLTRLSVALVTYSRCQQANDQREEALASSTEAILILRLLLRDGQQMRSTGIHLRAALELRADISDALKRPDEAIRDRGESFELWLRHSKQGLDCKDIAPFFRALCLSGQYERAHNEALRAENLRFSFMHMSQTPPNVYTNPKSPLLMLSEICQSEIPCSPPPGDNPPETPALEAPEEAEAKVLQSKAKALQEEAKTYEEAETHQVEAKARKTKANTLHAEAKALEAKVNALRAKANALKQAESIALQAIDFHRQRKPTHTEVHDADLALSRLCLSDVLRDQNRYLDALSCAKEAEGILRRHLSSADEAFTSELVSHLERDLLPLGKSGDQNSGLAAGEVDQLCAYLSASIASPSVLALHVALGLSQESVVNSAGVRQILETHQRAINLYPSVHSGKCRHFWDRLSGILDLIYRVHIEASRMSS